MNQRYLCPVCHRPLQYVEKTGRSQDGTQPEPEVSERRRIVYESGYSCDACMMRYGQDEIEQAQADQNDAVAPDWWDWEERDGGTIAVEYGESVQIPFALNRDDAYRKLLDWAGNKHLMN